METVPKAMEASFVVFDRCIIRMPSHPFVSGAAGRKNVSITFFFFFFLFLFSIQDLTAAAEKCVTNSLSYPVNLSTLER